MNNGLGERLISDAKELILNENSSIENIREAMNAVYRFYKNDISGSVRISDKRLIEVFKLEQLLRKKYLPIDSEPVYDEHEEVRFPASVETEEDCHMMMRAIVHETRRHLSERYDLKVDSMEKDCIMTSAYVSEICKGYGVDERSFSLDTDLSLGLFHCFNVVSFNVGDEVKSYLVDCTYRQFFTYGQAFVERIGMPYNSGGSLGGYMLMDERRREIAGELLKNGYVEFTPEIAKAYFDGIVFAGRNGLYYDSLGKDVLSKSDFEPQYTFDEYMKAIDEGGLGEFNNERQFGVMSRPGIQFDSDSAMPYLQQKNTENADAKKQTVL